MRAWLLIPLLLVVAACMPRGPTGNIVAPPSHSVNGNTAVTTEIFPHTDQPATVRVTATGDIVYRAFRVDGQPYTLVGQEKDNQWLTGSGTAIVYLWPGTHTIDAYTCTQTLTSWKCGCTNGNDCGHWMQETIDVPNASTPALPQ